MKITKEQLNAMQGRIKSKATGIDMLVGIDPGVNTGYACYSVANQALVSVTSMGIIEAMEQVATIRRTMRFLEQTMHVYVEDTRKLRLPKALQSKGRERGAGSVGRDMSIWSEYLTYYDIPHTMVGLAPKEYRESTDEWFRTKTGWDKRTNEHGRCAAGLILSRL